MITWQLTWHLSVDVPMPWERWWPQRQIARILTLKYLKTILPIAKKARKRRQWCRSGESAKMEGHFFSTVGLKRHLWRINCLLPQLTSSDGKGFKPENWANKIKFRCMQPITGLGNARPRSTVKVQHYKWCDETVRSLRGVTRYPAVRLLHWSTS